MNIQKIINTITNTSNSAYFFTPPIYGKRETYLFLKPKKIITIKSVRNLNRKLAEVDKLIKEGLYGYSLMDYEAGFMFEKSLNKYLPKNERLMQFFFYDKASVKKIKSIEIDFNEQKNFKIKKFRLNSSKNDFSKSFRKIKSYIQEGDTYQVNFSLKGSFQFEGSISDLFTNLIFNQSAKYIAIINNYGKMIISLSPELFFEIDGSKIISKPMKGTSQRGINLSSDSLINYQLESSEKNMAENLMIVDLIRNDLGKISELGSVDVKSLFKIEKFESVYQMVSTIEAKLRKDVKLSEVVKNIFPCGSITGAPKIRTMEIIKYLEKEERGIYTGAIGLIRKNKITFNVPIRTLRIDKKSNIGTIGLGSGIVWDSVPEEEYRETKLKGKFLTDPSVSFEIFESMLIKDREIFLLEEHLDRMQNAAEYFLFCFDRVKIKSEIENYVKQVGDEKCKLRIVLCKYGKLTITKISFPTAEREVQIIISKNRINSKNKFQYFKTTNRALYNREFKRYSAKDFFDVIYFNENGELAEGSFTNIFVHKNGTIATPPINAGILEGVYRKYLLKNSTIIREQTMSLGDLLDADKIVLTNSVRGEVIVNKLFVDENEFIEFK